MNKPIDCVVCGSCTVDIPVKPVPLERAIGVGKLTLVDAIVATTGGLVSNSGIAMARLGLKVAAFSFTGDDDWATIIRRTYQSEGIDASHLLTHPRLPTCTTIALIDANGERSFLTNLGAPNALTRETFLSHLDLFAASRAMLFGYYSLMPELDEDLPEVFAKIRETGCLTALDAVGNGGTMQPLDRILPHLDCYVPSLSEAAKQTGQTDPRQIIETYRNCGAPGLLGVKLGSKGALLSPGAGEFVTIDPVPPPGQVFDTTGAGDAFYAGLLTGLIRGMPVKQAGQLAAAAGACCVTGLGASSAMRSFDETMKLVAVR